MALNSPGVQVSIIDQSQYLPSASSSVPLLFVASALNKASGTNSTSIAAGTLESNANKLYQLTSQQDLVTLFGNPFFYKTTDGTPLHGYELNEYGLLAAYSLLGSTSSCYILRADIDLASLVGSLSRPSGPPPDGTYWLDTTNTSWGIFEFDADTGAFNSMTPYVLTSSAQYTTDNGNDATPLPSIGNPGDYAVIPAMPVNGMLSQHTYFYKTPAHAGNASTSVWTGVGSRLWKLSIPTAVGTNQPVNGHLNAGDVISININGKYTVHVTVPTSPNNTVTGLATAINSLSIADLKADSTTNSGSLSIFFGEYDQYGSSHNNYITLTTVSGTALADLGLDGTYYSPDVSVGSSNQMPLWTTSQSMPRPSGSVWIKTSATGSGIDFIMNRYSLASNQWIGKTVNVYSNEQSAIYNLDSTGGQAIPTNTLIATVGTQGYPDSAVMFYYRLTTGITVVTSSVSSFNLSGYSGDTLRVLVTIPNQTTRSSIYSLTIGDGTIQTFVSSWQAAQIPYTKIAINTDGSITISHTAGGEILLSDTNANGVSTGLIDALGFGTSTAGVRKSFVDTFVKTTSTTTLTGGGSGATVTVTNNGFYSVVVNNGGSGYAVGDTINISGTSLGGVSPDNDLKMVVELQSGGVITALALTADSGVANPLYLTSLSNWYPLTYISNSGAPASLPSEGENWYFSTPTEVDILVNKNHTWVGYRSTNYDTTGHPTNGSNQTDPTGIIMSATTPTTQNDGVTMLAYGDLWLDTSDLENYPKISRWQNLNNVDQWVAISNTDQISSAGMLFADARWGSSGLIDPVNDPIPTIASLLNSNYVDLDCPNPYLYPQGMLLFNTRRSGFNIKRFERNYFSQSAYPAALLPTVEGWTGGITQLPMMPYAWVSTSGHKEDGSAFMGRKAQRNMVVKAMKAAINTNTQIREEDTFINLLAAPGYPELQADMVSLNNDRNNTAFIIGDTPLRLSDEATSLTNWATNTALATETGEDGWVTRDTYLGVFYPSGITTDLTGTDAVVPASHMMLKTFLNNDTVAYPWLAAAGIRRGNITNATNIGYLNGQTGLFNVVKNRNSIRDVLYENQINPLAYFTGVGLLNYGNKTSYASQSSLDRVNVARLICYIRYQLSIAARPFVFEPNDDLTRTQITGVIQSLFIDLISKRGLYDYLVVCDTTNNTPDRIDRNELWVDIAIEPTITAEFIYIPVRVVATGTLSNTSGS
jgi:hypothetical protein